MKQDQIKRLIEENAEECKRLHVRIHETVKLRDKGPKKKQEWEEACAEFHTRYSNLAFPGGYDGALERILAGDPNTVEVALCFVECRPYFFRSGYMFKDLLRKLKKAPLSATQEKRLSVVVEKYTEYKKRRKQGEEIS
jgi:hypothetical protein